MATTGSFRCVAATTCLFDTWADGSIHFLVGQRSTTDESASFLLLETFPCEDTEVAEEQRDCLESVLPAGARVIGFGVAGSLETGDKQRLGACLTASSAGLTEESVFVSKTPTSLVATLTSSPSVKATVDIHDVDIVWNAKCTVSVPPSRHPLLLRKGKGGNATSPVPLDPASRKRMPLPDGARDWDSCELVQLGAAPAWAQFPLTLCSESLSGQQVSSAIAVLQENSVVEPTHSMSVVQVRSTRPSSLVYACRVARRASASSGAASAPLTRKEWSTVRNTIEDATGERVQPSQLLHVSVEGTPGASPKPADGSPGASPVACNPTEKTGGLPNAVIFVAAAVLLCAIALVLGRSG